MYKLLGREIAEFIVEHDADYYNGLYQFAGLRVHDTDGNEISLDAIDEDEIDEEEIDEFNELQKNIQNLVGCYFNSVDVEKFVKKELGLITDGINIEIESI